MRAVTWARDAIFFRFFLGLAAFGAWGLGAPSHPTTCAFGLDLARLRTWVPIVRFGGEGDPGGGHHDAARGRVVWLWLLGVLGCHPWPSLNGHWPTKASCRRKGRRLSCRHLHPSPSCTVMRHMFVHVFQVWVPDVQPNIRVLGHASRSSGPFGVAGTVTNCAGHPLTTSTSLAALLSSAPSSSSPSDALSSISGGAWSTPAPAWGHNSKRRGWEDFSKNKHLPDGCRNETQGTSAHAHATAPLAPP